MDWAMASGMGPKKGDLIFAAALAAAFSIGFAHDSEAFGRRRNLPAFDEGRGVAPPPVARFAIDDGGEFILDQQGHDALIRFSDSPEVWALSRSRGPRGDIIYKNDNSEPMLRATKLGGMTVFTPKHPEGAAAALLGPAMPVRLTPLGPLILYQRLVQASVRSSRAAQHGIEFDAPDADPTSDSVIADAAAAMVEALVSLSGRPGGHAILRRLGSVAIQSTGKSTVELRGRVVTISVNPALGYAGRPSSERILLALGAR
jgi:hypothetical protein